MARLKPYRYVPIQEWGEPLVPIPGDQVALTLPHPYANLGAPYGHESPFALRQSVLKKLLQAQDYLQQIKPGWRLSIFDGYRPNSVQKFMVVYTYEELLKIHPEMSPEARWAQVYQIWAVPSDDPATPPPHSTGAAVDLTLINEQGQVVDMGSPIDELSPRSLPDYYPQASTYTAQRNLLNQVMNHAGFARHPEEWWHFSWGDQLWAWVTGAGVAHYGRVGEPPKEIPHRLD